MVGASVVVAVVGAMVTVVLACVVTAVVVLDKAPKDRKERKTPLISTFFAKIYIWYTTLLIERWEIFY